jgi:hypothetical protein
VTGIKTHFVLIDYVDNSFYEIRARQHDGYTGQSTPVIRREQTNSRDFLARTIGLLLDSDFGVVGEITSSADENKVEVTLKGAGLDVPLLHWVRPGDVFALVEIVQSGMGLKANPVPSALLQAQDTPNKSGVVKCRFFHRHIFSFNNPTPGSKGFRCIKLATTKAPLRLRLVEWSQRGLTPLNGYKVVVHRQGFGLDRGEETATNSDGFTKLFGGKENYDNVAFVQIYDPAKQGKEVLARVPVPILDDRPVIITLRPKKEAATPLELRLGFWVKRINDRLVENQGIFTELSREVPQADKLNATLQRAQVIKVDLDQDIENFQKERKDLEEAAKDPPVTLDLKEGDQLLQLLERDRKALEKFVSGLRDSVDRENDPVRREFLSKWEQAKGFERDTEYDRAIQLYEEAQQGLKDDGLGKHLEKLKKDWAPKSKEHETARAFIYKEWPDFDIDHAKDQIASARAAFDTCKKENDYLTPQKLLRVALGHDKKLKEFLASLNPTANEDQRQPHAEALAASNELAKLMKDVTSFLRESLEKK